jgi:hypothetical protein
MFFSGFENLIPVTLRHLEADLSILRCIKLIRIPLKFISGGNPANIPCRRGDFWSVNVTETRISAGNNAPHCMNVFCHKSKETHKYCKVSEPGN